MMNLEIPGWGNIDIENVVFDLNGTLATDGKLTSEVRDKINTLSEKVKVFILTADTQGTANDEIRDVDVSWVKVSGEDTAKGKMEFLKTINPERTVAIGNGDNDHLILKEAALGIAVLGEEGLCTSAMREADIVVKTIADAFNLFLKPKRLIAALRK
jgi:soluble P-type ATPase